MAKLGAFVVLTPAAGIMLGAFMSFTGNEVLADQDILYFLLSPWGVVALVLVGGLALAIVALELACLMTIGLGVVRSQRVTVLAALRFVAGRVAGIWRLTARALLQVLLRVLPFAAVAAGVYAAVLGDYDINFYLSQRPGSFWLAVVAIGSLALGAGVVVVPRLLGWFYALPILLFENASPSQALEESRERVDTHRPSVIRALTAWLVGSLVLAALLSASMGFVGRLVLFGVERSVPLLVLVSGGVFLLFSVGNLIVSFVQSASLALLCARYYEELANEGGTMLPATATDSGDSSVRSSAGWKLVLAGLAVGVLACGTAGIVLLEGVRAADDVLVAAHRGASGRAPENTLAAIRAAVEDGADVVEIDVQETADGEVVVIHDSDFMRIGSVDLKVWDARYQEARAIDIGSWFAPEFSSERLPTLAEVLAICKGKALVDIELKYYGHDERLEEKVVAIVEQADMASDVLVMSLELAGIEKIRAMRPGWTVGLLTATALGDLTRIDVDFLAVHSSLATPGFIGRAHDAGKKVFVWTVNDAPHMSHVVTSGVDSIITDEPALAKRLLAARAELSAVERLLLELTFWLGVTPKEPPPETDLGGV